MVRFNSADKMGFRAKIVHVAQNGKCSGAAPNNRTSPRGTKRSQIFFLYEALAGSSTPKQRA